MRFPEFTDKLSNVKLSSLFKKCTQKNKDGQVTNVICNSAKNGLVPQRDFFDKDIANAENTASYYIIQKQDFVYNPRKSNEAPYGPISMYKYEEDGIVSPLYLCFRLTEPLCANFFETYFKSCAWHRYIYLMGDSGARHDRVSIKDEVFFDMPINIPALPEQEKIAEFLSLVDERIEQQRQLVEALKRYKRGVINKVLSSIKQTDMVLLKDLVTKGHVKLGRGNVIPKYKKDESKIYPVYSSSTHNDGLMGFYDSFMFDNELITWSIDGGGNFFYRKKHKFNVTNVCGILELDSTQYNYKFIAECLIHQHERKHFDYLSKAHPSVIIDMYKLPNISIDVQQKYATLFLAFDDLIIASEQVVDNLRQVKTALLQQMFI